MKEQLERMFPGAVVAPYRGGGATAADGPVSVTVTRSGHKQRFDARSAFQHFPVGDWTHRDTLTDALVELRESVRRESVMAPTKTARARAARVLRVLDAAKVGEMTL